MNQLKHILLFVAILCVVILAIVAHRFCRSEENLKTHVTKTRILEQSNRDINEWPEYNNHLFKGVLDGNLVLQSDSTILIIDEDMREVICKANVKGFIRKCVGNVILTCSESESNDRIYIYKYRDGTVTESGVMNIERINGEYIDYLGMNGDEMWYVRYHTGESEVEEECLYVRNILSGAERMFEIKMIAELIRDDVFRVKVQYNILNDDIIIYTIKSAFKYNIDNKELSELKLKIRDREMVFIEDVYVDYSSREIYVKTNSIYVFTCDYAYTGKRAHLDTEYICSPDMIVVGDKYHIVDRGNNYDVIDACTGKCIVSTEKGIVMAYRWINGYCYVNHDAYVCKVAVNGTVRRILKVKKWWDLE